MAKTHEEAALAVGEIQGGLESVGGVVQDLAESAQDGAGIADGEVEVATKDGTDGLQLRLEGGGDSEIRPGPAQAQKRSGSVSPFTSTVLASALTSRAETRLRSRPRRVPRATRVRHPE